MVPALTLERRETPGVDELVRRVVPRRQITGISAILLPFNIREQLDEEGLAEQLKRCTGAGLTPAVNMDTGYVHLLTDAERGRVLEVAREVLQGRRFVAGAFIEGKPGEPLELLRGEIEKIRDAGATPIIFPCSALKRMDSCGIVEFYGEIARMTPEFYAFELGEMFAPFGMIYDLDTFSRLMEIPQITGLKHSSLQRVLEWQRLELRDRLRPEFKIFTGNDLAIDMVMYGSDYLLGLSAFYPEAFALRDRLWLVGDARFYALNDLLQYLGMFAFRSPVPGYRHNAAQFLALRGVIRAGRAHPYAPRRPESDVAVLQDICDRLEAFCKECPIGSL